MPELPEVETNMRNLSRWTLGKRVLEVTPAPLLRSVTGHRVKSLSRRGKWILVRMSDNAGLALHLGMTGKLVRVRPSDADPRSSRASFLLDNGARIHFVDPRRFGRMITAPNYDELIQKREIATLGPDALNLTAPLLRERMTKTTRPIKEALMDQTLVSGIGNLYATEALWYARIHPTLPARLVVSDRRALHALLRGIHKALRSGLEYFQKMEIPHYVEEGGSHPFKAYARGGKPCPRCGTRLSAMRLGGRTTIYCPKCLPLTPLG